MQSWSVIKAIFSSSGSEIQSFGGDFISCLARDESLHFWLSSSRDFSRRLFTKRSAKLRAGFLSYFFFNLATRNKCINSVDIRASRCQVSWRTLKPVENYAEIHPLPLASILILKRTLIPLLANPFSPRHNAWWLQDVNRKCETCASRIKD